jgi:hypothetical protein
MIHKTSLKYLLLLVCSGVLYSCTPGATIDKTITVDEVKRRVNANSNRISSVDAEGSIYFETPEESNSAFMTLSIHKPDSLYAKFQGPFGITAGNVLVTRENFIYFNALENIVIKGPSSPLNLGAVLRIRVAFDDLISGLSSSMTFEDVTSENTDLTVLDDQYVLTVMGNINRKYWINSNFSILRYIEYTGSSTNPSLEIKYFDHIEDGGKYFPKKIEINRPDASQYVAIDFRDFTLNKNRLNFKIVLPETAKVIQWD